MVTTVCRHGGKNHLALLYRIVDEESKPWEVAVRQVFALAAGEKGGHAERGGTAFMLALLLKICRSGCVALAFRAPRGYRARHSGSSDLLWRSDARLYGTPRSGPRYAAAADCRANMARKAVYAVQRVRGALVTVACVP